MIKFENVCKSYKDKQILKNISFEISAGSLVAIIGESGCGKTTLLKMINRLIPLTSGKILVNDAEINSLDVIELRRKIGYVIQQTGLFPHMTVKENIEIISILEKMDRNKVEEKARNLLNMVGLNPDEYLNRFPKELSGGQQQRVGVARAFAQDPEIILMDEPFSALDPITRSDLQDELSRLQSKLKKTIVFVTHDMDEAIKIADKILILKQGEILQYDTPENILKYPANEFVIDFVGRNRIWASPEFIKVQDFMIKRPISANPELSIIKCLDKMRRHRVDSLLITEHGTNKFLGVVKAKTIRNAQNASESVGTMLQDEPNILLPTNTIIEALEIVNKKDISTIPVVDEFGVLKGLVTKSSLVTTLSAQYLDMEV